MINRAIDVRTACMQYFASNIRRDATTFGTLGNFFILNVFPLSLLIDSGKVTKTIFKGDERITDATSLLKSSIDSYNNALGNINLRIVIKVYELLKGTHIENSFGLTVVNIHRCEYHENSRRRIINRQLCHPL